MISYIVRARADIVQDYVYRIRPLYLIMLRHINSYVYRIKIKQNYFCQRFAQYSFYCVRRTNLRRQFTAALDNKKNLSAAAHKLRVVYAGNKKKLTNTRCKNLVI